MRKSERAGRSLDNFTDDQRWAIERLERIEAKENARDKGEGDDDKGVSEFFDAPGFAGLETDETSPMGDMFL